ncbi:MAG: hypothetical protein CMD14_06415 [Flavobacteriales bacterium]|nr:hypothetical protein [Flavobacteriales bacterium]
MKYNYSIFLLLNLVNQATAFTSYTPRRLSSTLLRGAPDVSSYNEMDIDDEGPTLISVDALSETDNIIDVEEQSQREASQSIDTDTESTDADINMPTPSNVLFYTGKLRTALPSDIYNTFLNKLSESKKVYIASSDLEKNLALVNNIAKTDTLSVISHSTSASDAIDLIKYLERDAEDVSANIANLVLIDPIDHYYFKNNINLEQYNVFKYLEKMDDMEEQISSFIEADKLNLVFKAIFKPGQNRRNKLNKKTLILKSSISNRWKIFPPIPPINKYSLNLNQLKNKKVKTIENYGHFDILDPTWSNMVHNTFSKGAPSRESSNLENYHELLIEQINNFSQ